MFSLTNNKNGFSLIEVAIVMVIMGILAGGGISMMRTLTERKFRNEAFEYMKEVKEALITDADIHGRLRCPDTDGDGNENNDEHGTPSDLTDDTCEDDLYDGEMPYLDLGVKPADPYKNVLRYEININLARDRSTSCEKLRSGLIQSESPLVVDVDDPSATSFEVAAVIVSSGPSNADSSGDWFDDITTGTHLGDNSDGNPNYIRSFPRSDFDDFVMYIGENELYGKFCKTLVLSVTNNCGSRVFISNETIGVDLLRDSDDQGFLDDTETGKYTIVSGTKIELKDAGGNHVDSSQPTPIILSGSVYMLNAIP